MSGDQEKIHITWYPSGVSVTAAKGSNLLECVRQAGLGLNAYCGGIGLCGKCRVRIRRGKALPSPADRQWLTETEIKEGFRLACKAVIEDDCEIEIPQTFTEGKSEILVHGLRQLLTPQPAVRKQYVQLQPPQLAENSADLESLLKALGLKIDDIQVPLSLLQRLPQQLREEAFSGTAVFFEHCLLDFERGDTQQLSYGLAVDLGTTTIVAKLFHLFTGRNLAVEARLNTQRSFGEDVITRIGYADQHRQGLEKLQMAAITDLNEMIASLCDRADIAKDQIYHLVVAGNTVMQHFLLGVSPRYLAQMPYVPVFRAPLRFSAEALKLNIHPSGIVEVLPAIGRFVGGDTTAVLLTLADKLQGTWLAIDIGTNGELILCHRGRLWATSAAAGPAFEGAHISKGMRATTGAIERVFWHNNRLNVRVIGDGKAIGLCGSALMDAIGSLLQANAMDPTGRLIPEHPLVTTKMSFPELSIHPEDFPVVFLSDTEVYLTQKDIRETQLAKSAIATAAQILLQQADITAADLEAVYLAGAFGQYIRADMALAMGLLPPVSESQIHFIGNAAAAGAELALLSSVERQQAKQLAEKVEYVEIANHPMFQELFAENLLFLPQKWGEKSSKGG